MPLVRVSELTTIERAARLYGLEVSEYLPVIKGYRNESNPLKLTDGSILNLIIYKREPNIVRTIQSANRVSNFVALHGFPARRTLDSRILRLSGQNNRYAALYNYLPGQTISWEAYTQKHLKLLGKTMGDLHDVLAGFDAESLPDAAGIYLEIFTRMQHYFAKPGVRKALAEKLQLAPPDLKPGIVQLRASKFLPKQQALHMDFVRGNILFGDASGVVAITGILDFEKTARGHVIFDIARTLAFLLVDCKYKPTEKVWKYFIRSGYQKRGAADFKNVTMKTGKSEADLLSSLVRLFLLHDFYKFLRHNPYESLPKNEHFVRTRDLLLQAESGGHHEILLKYI